MSLPLANLLGKLSPQNQKWIEELPEEKQAQLLHVWQEEEGGSAGLNPQTAPSFDSADALIAEYKEGRRKWS